MSQSFTLHTHTAGFDGKNTVAEMARAARANGMDTLGVSNHFILHPTIKSSAFYPYAVSRGYQNIYASSVPEILNRFSPHYDEIHQAGDKYGVRLLRGMEADFFLHPKWRQSFETAIQVLQPDYIIGAVHFVEMNGRVYNVHDIAAASADDQAHMLRAYWQKIRAAASTGLFNWIAHLDLPRKVWLGLSPEWMDEEQQTINVLAQKSVPFEVNTGGIAATGAPYPSFRILQAAGQAKLPVLFSDDAHSVDQIGRDFADASEFANEMGATNRLSLQKILAFSHKNR